MVRLSKKWIAVAFLCLMGLNASSIGVALPYNIYLNGGVIKSYPRTDLYTGIPNQICDFTINRLITQQNHITASFSLDSYNNGQELDGEWCAKGDAKKVGTLGIISTVNVFKSVDDIIWEGYGSQTYPSAAKSAQASIKIEHFSLNDNFNSKNNYDAIGFHSINSSTIGEVSVDIMPHLSYNAANENVLDGAEGILHVELLHDKDETAAVNVTFKTKSYGTNQYQLIAYCESLNPTTGLKNTPIQIFQGYPDNFNWLNLKVFYDTYNDVYNITISQYTKDFGDYLVQPVSTIIQGTQVKDTELYNIGYRYAEGQLINKIKFHLKSFAIDERKSYVYISNLETRGYEFPAIYADVMYNNWTIMKDPDTADGISYIKNTIISCYEPPKYPDGSYSISYGNVYFNTVQNQGILTTWNFAPSWVYALPIVVTNNHSLNVASILHVFNDLDWLLEERGIIKPTVNSEFYTDPQESIAAKFFELNSTMSRPYYYYFESRYSDTIFVIEYNYGSDDSGILKKVTMHEKSININPFFEYETDFRAGDGPNLQVSDLPVELLAGVLVGIVAVALVAIFYFKRKQVF